MEQVNLEVRAEEILRQCSLITLASVNEEGYPRPCVVVKLKHEGFGKVWFSTGAHSHKVAQIRKNTRAGVCYYDANHGVTLLGEAKIVEDMETKKQLWSDWMLAHFPKGVNDPECCVIQFIAKEATFYIDNQFETHQY